ncbi:MAG: tetratricopeptide repeat protein [Verrucomicrobia bacterium]|nr:tetratricopeptide repeat protein [Verrucomicrobiota bacterium]
MRRWLPMSLAALIAMVAMGIWKWGNIRNGGLPQLSSNSPAGRAPFKTPSDQEVFSTYAGSESCRDCHAQAYGKWTNSHHALAERRVDAHLDLRAFEPAHAIKHGTQTSEARTRDGQFQLTTMGADGRPATFKPDRVLGVDPLRQFLFATAGGRWQVGELSFDPRTNDWFDVYGTEDRVAGEWGHWTGRGMTWNSMCASCHNTRLRKNYNPANDSYSTTMAERGVGCESCHGPLKQHVTWQRERGGSATNDPTLRRLDKNQMLDTCGSCHSRRGELTGDFVPGQKFSDHYSLTIPDETDVFYPDGQVREEDYEFTSFLSSRMHTAGVRCTDCHEPHSSKAILPGDALCLRCHAVPVAPAPKIDVLTHSHHKAGTPGSHCVDCHMPQTTYMQRHARRDHGFTIPDPLLTKQHRIPNACNRCHADRSVDWAIEAVDKWHGPRMNRPTRTRAQWMVQARAGHTNAPSNLMRMLAEEKAPLWRASAARLLQSWSHDPDVSSALLRAVRDPDPLVRANVAHSLEGIAQPENLPVQAALRELLNDSSRSVSVAAAWVARAQLDTNTPAAHDLFLSLHQNSDQPTGLHQMGSWHFDRNENAAAMELFRRAVEWDANSPPFRHTYAIALSTQGRTAEAVAQLEAACRLAPREAEYRYQLGLALNEAGKLPEATAALQEAVKLNAQFGPAWYNLGLAYSAANSLERSVEALRSAERCQPASPRAPYALATVLARLGRIPEAHAAARRALAVQPSFREAAELLRTLTREDGGRGQ